MLSPWLTPRQAADLLDLSESTIRRWCDAGLVPIQKTAGGHRRIESQSLLRFAREQGLQIVDASPLSTAGRGGRLHDPAVLAKQFYQELISGDESSVEQFIQGVLDRTGDCARICDEIITPAMHRIGDEWEKDQLKIYREHAATQRALLAITQARARFAPLPSDAPVAICAALPGDPYALAPAMCSLVMREAGFLTVSLGPNTPPDEILVAAIELSAVAVTVSVSVSPADPTELAALCQRAQAARVRVALGGGQLSPLLRRDLRPDFFGDTMGHLSAYAKRLVETIANER